MVIMPISLTNKSWVVVGVSGGPDSMALLDMLRTQDQYRLVAVHINYQMRESANRDQDIVERYGKQYQIPVISYQAHDLTQGNFQHNARHFRLRCYKEVYEGYQAVALYLGHHDGDQLETILFQLLSNRQPDYLGLKSSSKLFNMLVRRPLLDKTKQELIDYCHSNNIEYGIDESNTSDKYTRNRIRKVLSEMTEEQKSSLIQYQKLYSRRNKVMKSTFNKFFKFDKTQFDIVNYAKFDESTRLFILREFLNVNGLNTIKMTRKQVKELDRLILKNQNQLIEISKTKTLLIEYGMVRLMETKFKGYHYRLTEYERLDTPFFKLNEHVGMGLSVTQEDYPIVVRNARPDDKIQMKYGTKKLNRFFIDRKISHRDRRYWPVIENRAGEVIFVAELGCDVNHYNPPYNLKLKRKPYGY